MLYSEDEEDLRAAVRRLLDDHCIPAEVLARTESGTPHDRALWKLLAEDMGLAGLLVPEYFGGQGATHREVAVVLEELGRSLAPVPFLTSAVVATDALLGCVADHAGVGLGDALAPGDAGAGTEDAGSATSAGGGGSDERGAGAPAAELLAELATGRTVAVLALPLAMGAGAFAGGEAAVGAGCPRVRHEGGALHGQITGVADAATADVLLVSADTGLYAVDVRQDGVVVTARTSLDGTRPLADVALTAARGRILTAHPQRVLPRALDVGAGLLASEQLGIADWCLTETVRYTRDRHQFNRPVGSFQALKHRLAQLWLRIVHTRAAARNAADALATGSPETVLAVALAQSSASDTAVHAAEEALQLHGGIGMTWEHPVHLYLKRAKANSIALGTAAQHRQRLASLVDLAPPAG
ncbi:acyl-CoA dehydrogenase family protein [Streptomyces odontomachi]|uniref:acyl-CoA dehydrogenase family protein n=1 Tax=Streptomyces odontomachi TaxID=2944940 RepID=UPI00210B390C|nr:acyl-CoA dehydrogenase family protein [Streptomyces sp. ODS25]